MIIHHVLITVQMELIYKFFFARHVILFVQIVKDQLQIVHYVRMDFIFNKVNVLMFVQLAINLLKLEHATFVVMIVLDWVLQQI